MANNVRNEHFCVDSTLLTIVLYLILACPAMREHKASIDITKTTWRREELAPS
ncbi:MAG: hypothetical protein Q7V53_01950 [Caldisericota bacterium]|nr:hypothetical protein [Caldisericota bacterium]